MFPKMSFKRAIAQLVMIAFVFIIALGGIVTKSGNLALADTKETSLVVMGDSISYGMSADADKGFAKLYLQHLIEVSGNAKLNNLSVPGYKASDLLQQLPTQAYSGALATADLVVVSIGGNHLLSPVIAAISKAFNVSTSSPNYLEELANKVKNDPNASATMLTLLGPDFLAALDAGVNSFQTEFPQVIAEIGKKAPNAEVYVLDLYNPFGGGDSLGTFFGTYISKLNTIIEGQSKTAGFTVVPVNKAFAGNADAVKFNPSLAQLDPHPTNVGHDLICKQLISVEKPRSTNAVTPTPTPTPTTSGSVETEEPKDIGLSAELKQSFESELQAAKVEKAAADKAIQKAAGDLVKLDKDMKALKAKLTKLKSNSEKTKANLQLAAMAAKRKALVSAADHKKAVSSKNVLIIGINGAVLAKYEAAPDSTSLTQQELDKMTAAKAAASKLVDQKKAAADKAAVEATKAAAKAK